MKSLIALRGNHVFCDSRIVAENLIKNTLILSGLFRN